MSLEKSKIEIYRMPEEGLHKQFPFVGDVVAGFPSPAGDFEMEPLDILGKYTKNSEAIFIGRAYGVSMDGFIDEGDYFLMDRSLRLDPIDGDIAVCALNGEFTLKQIHIKEDGIELVPYNKNYPVIPVHEDDNFTIWAIVTLIIRPTPTRWLR
ncbi:LexA family protein [Falsiporphyromonas endometrii]|uniref:LexA family protein n=1 Tax=Falsiporphyromonas endometrii TaxID=1387297 RepID=A0ABV9K670_9PORP